MTAVPDQHPVGHRVEHLAERRHLVVAPGHEAVDPVGCSEHRQQDGGRRLLVAPNSSHRNRGMHSSRTSVMTLGTVTTRSNPLRRPRVASLREPRHASAPPVCQSGRLASFRRFPGPPVPTRAAPLAQVIAPPYDVITPAERVHLATRNKANAVLVELPEADLQGGRDRYTVATDLFYRWINEGILLADPSRASTRTA